MFKDNDCTDRVGRCKTNSGHVCYSDYTFHITSEHTIAINANTMSCFSSIITYVIMKITQINKFKHQHIKKMSAHFCAIFDSSQKIQSGLGLIL